jgi:hypothetical protein
LGHERLEPHSGLTMKMSLSARRSGRPEFSKLDGSGLKLNQGP